MANPVIYLDNNATTFADPIVVERMRQLSAAGLANPASQHRLGRQALGILEDAKADLLNLLGAPTNGMDSGQVILTSGGTEANNLALHALSQHRPGLVIVSSIEHPSISEAVRHPEICNRPVRSLPVDRSGRCNLNMLEEWLRAIYAGQAEQDLVSFVSVMHGNNETGVIQDLSEVVKLCSRYEVPVHSDVVQSAGKIDFSMQCLGLTALTISAHKFHGPVGVGALIANPELPIQPMLIGGSQQVGWRAGTEPVALAAGMATALSLAVECQRSGSYLAIDELRKRFELALVALGDVVINAADAERLPHTTNCAFLGLDRQALLMAFDLEGIACSTGSACASGSGRPSPGLIAMGLPDRIVNSSLRFSMSRFTTADEIDLAIERIERIITKLRATRPG